MLLVAAFGLQEVAQAAPDGVFQAGPAGSAAAAKRVPFPTDPRDLQIPVQNLQVRSIHRGSGDRLIVLLQDAHTNFGAQENLSKALGFWLDRYRLNLVLSEGGSGDLSLVGARGAMPPADLKRAARRLLWEGLLTGHEFANLTLPQEFRIVGIEDESLYEENLLEFAGLVRERAAAVRELSLARAGIERLKNGIYPRDLLRYEQQRDAAGEGLGGLNTESLLELAQHAGIDVDQYPAILRLEQLKRREKRLDLRRANAEQAELMERLVRERGRANWTEIFEQAAQAQDPAQRSAALRAILRGARAQGIEIRRYAELRRYLGYLEAIGRLDLEDVLGQIRLLEEACYSEILKTPEDFTVHAVDRHVRILKKAYEIRLGNDDYQSYLGRRGQLTPISWQAFVNDRLAQQDAFDLWIPYQKSSETAESKIRRFYRTVSRRDRAFVDRALQAMEREGEKSAVLVTGGYHTEHLIELFRRRGVSVLTAAPHVAAETDAAKYEALVLASVSPSHLTPDGLMDAPAQSQDPNTRTLMPPLARSHLAAARMASRSAGLPEDARELLNRISDVILSARPGGARMAKSSDKLPKNYSNFKASEAYGFIRRLFQGDPMAEYSRDENGFIEVPEGQTMIGIQGGLQRANLRPDNPDETIEHQIRSGLSANPEERLNTRVHVREVTDEGERHALGVKNSDVRVHVFRFSSKNSLGIDGVSHLFTRSDERIYAHLGNELEYFQYRLFKGDPFHDRPRDDEGFMEAPECRSMIGRQGELRLSNLKPNNPNETIVAGQRISIPVDPKDRQDFAVHVKEVMDEAERYELGVMNPDIRVHLFRFSFKDSSGAARSIYIFTRSDADNYYQLKSVYQSFQKKLFLGEDMTGYARDEEGFIRAPQGQEMIGTDGAFLGSNPKPNNPSETIAFSQRISLPVDPGDRQGLAVHVKEVTDAAERYELGVMNPDIRVHLFRFSFKDSSGAARSIYIFTRSDADRYYDLTAVYQSFQKKLYLGEDMTGYARDEEGFIRVPQGQEMISSEGLTRALNLNPNDPDRALKFQCSIGLSHDSSERRDMTIHVKELDPEDIHFFKGHPKPSRSGKTHLFYARIKRSDGSAHRIHFFWNGKRFIAAKLSDHRTDPSNIHLLLAIGQALRTGDWSVIAEIYTRNLENIAVFWRHFYMMGVFLGGLSKEEAARVFKDPVLYLGTGPLDQSTALLIKTFEEQKLPLPSTIVLDRSLKMQKEASKRENEKGLRASFRLVGDFTRELPIEARSQSLVVAPSLTTLDSKTRNALMRNIQGVMKDRGYVILPADKAEIPQKTLDVLRDAGFALRRGPLQAEFSDAQRDMISRALSSSKAASAIVDKLHRIRSQFIILQFDEKSARPITADKSFEVVKVQEAKQESPYDDFEHHLRKKPRGVDLTQMDLSGMPDLFGFESAPKSSDADRDAQLIQWVADSTEDELVGKLMDDPRFADDPSAYLDKIQDALTRNPGLLSSLDATRRERVMRSVVLSLVFFLTSVKYEYYLKSEFKGFLDHKADPGAVTKQMLVDLLGQAPAATRIGTGTVKIARERIKKISSILTRPLGARLASEGGLAGEDEGREAIIASNVRRHRETTVPVEEAMSAEEIASVTRIVYPAAGGDDETIWLLAGIFPNVEEAVLIDPIYLGFEKDRSETIEGRTIRFRRTSADFLSWHPAAAGAAPRGGRTLVVDKGPGRNASLRDLPAYVPALMRTAGSDGWILSDQYMTPAGYPLRRAEHILGGGTLRSDRVSGRVRISDHPIRTWTLLKITNSEVGARLAGPMKDGGVTASPKMPVRMIGGDQAVGVARRSRAEGVHQQMEEILDRLVKLVPGKIKFVVFKYFADYEKYIRARLNLTVAPMMYYWPGHHGTHWIYTYGLNALPDIILHELIHALQRAPAAEPPHIMENLENLFIRSGEEGRLFLETLRDWEKAFSLDPIYAQSSREREFTAYLYQEFLVQKHPYRLKMAPQGSDAYYKSYFDSHPAAGSLHELMTDLVRQIVQMPDSRLRYDILNHLRDYYRALHPDIPLPFTNLKLVYGGFDARPPDTSRSRLIRLPSYGARLAEADPAALLGRIAQVFGDFKVSGYDDIQAATAAAQVRLRHVNDDAPTAEGKMSAARALRTAREEIFKGRLRLLQMPEAERIGASRTRPAWQHPDLGIPPGTVVMRSPSQTMVTPEELNSLPVLIYLGPNPWATGHYLLIAPDGELKSIWGDHLSHSDIYHRVNTPDPQEPLPRVQLGMALSQFTHAETADDVFRALEIWERFSRPLERWDFMERELGLDVAYPEMASFYLTLAERVLALNASQSAQPHESEQRFVDRLPDFIGRASGFLVLAEERAQSIAESGWRQRLWDRIWSFIGYDTRQQVFERLRERWLAVWEQRLESLMPLQEAEVHDDPMLRSLLLSVPVATERQAELVNAVEGLSGGNRKDILMSAKVFSNLIKTPGLDSPRKQTLHLAVEIALRFMSQMPPDPAPTAGPNGARLAGGEVLADVRTSVARYGSIRKGLESKTIFDGHRGIFKTVDPATAERISERLLEFVRQSALTADEAEIDRYSKIVKQIRYRSMDPIYVSPSNYLSALYDPDQKTLYLPQFWIDELARRVPMDVLDEALVREILYPAQRVAVLGGSGKVGRRIAAELRDVYPEVFAASRSGGFGSQKLNVTDETELAAWIDRVRPDVIVYAAGIADPDQAQRNPDEARLLNAEVPKRLRKMTQARLIYLSTDQVFDGRSKKPYRPGTRPRSVNGMVYGQTKIEGERGTLSGFRHRNAVLRLGLVVAEEDVEKIVHQIQDAAGNNALKPVFDDARMRYPVWVDDVATAVRTLVAEEKKGIYHLNGEEPTTRFEMARTVAEALVPDTAEQPIVAGSAAASVGGALAPRPENVRLENNWMKPRPVQERIGRVAELSSQKGPNALVRLDRAVRLRDERLLREVIGELDALGIHWTLVGPVGALEGWTDAPRVLDPADSTAVSKALLDHLRTPDTFREDLAKGVASVLMEVPMDRVSVLAAVVDAASDEYWVNPEKDVRTLRIVSTGFVYRGIGMRYWLSISKNGIPHGFGSFGPYRSMILPLIGRLPDGLVVPEEVTLQGGSMSTVVRVHGADGSTVIRKKAPAGWHADKLRDEARYMQALEATGIFPKVYDIQTSDAGTTVRMEDLIGHEQLTEVSQWAHLGFKRPEIEGSSIDRRTAYRSDWDIALDIYRSLIPIFYGVKSAETPSDFLRKFHFEKLETRWAEARSRSRQLDRVLAAPYIKDPDRRYGQLLPNLPLAKRAVEAIAAYDTEVLLPPYLTHEHGDLHFGNILINPADYFSRKRIDRFRLIDPKWLPKGNDPLYDLAKLMHNKYGWYDLALNHHESISFGMRVPESGGPAEFNWYFDDESYDGDRMRDEFGAVQDFSQQFEEWMRLPDDDPRVRDMKRFGEDWRTRLIFTHASLLAGLLNFHLLPEDPQSKISVIYWQAATQFDRAILHLIAREESLRSLTGQGRLPDGLYTPLKTMALLQRVYQQTDSEEAKSAAERQYVQTINDLQRYLDQNASATVSGARLAQAYGRSDRHRRFKPVADGDENGPRRRNAELEDSHLLQSALVKARLDYRQAFNEGWIPADRETVEGWFEQRNTNGKFFIPSREVVTAIWKNNRMNPQLRLDLLEASLVLWAAKVARKVRRHQIAATGLDPAAASTEDFVSEAIRSIRKVITDGTYNPDNGALTTYATRMLVWDLLKFSKVQDRRFKTVSVEQVVQAEASLAIEISADMMLRIQKKSGLLSELEWEIVQLRYGIGTEAESAEQIADIYGKRYSPEWIELVAQSAVLKITGSAPAPDAMNADPKKIDRPFTLRNLTAVRDVLSDEVLCRRLAITDRDRRIVSQLFGVDGYRRSPLVRIPGELSRERLRQVGQEVLKKIRDLQDGAWNDLAVSYGFTDQSVLAAYLDARTAAQRDDDSVRGGEPLPILRELVVHLQARIPRQSITLGVAEQIIALYNTRHPAAPMRFYNYPLPDIRPPARPELGQKRMPTEDEIIDLAVSRGGLISWRQISDYFGIPRSKTARSQKALRRMLTGTDANGRSWTQAARERARSSGIIPLILSNREYAEVNRRLRVLRGDDSADPTDRIGITSLTSLEMTENEFKSGWLKDMIQNHRLMNRVGVPRRPLPLLVHHQQLYLKNVFYKLSDMPAKSMAEIASDIRIGARPLSEAIDQFLADPVNGDRDRKILAYNLAMVGRHGVELPDQSSIVEYRAKMIHILEELGGAATVEQMIQAAKTHYGMATKRDTVLDHMRSIKWERLNRERASNGLFPLLVAQKTRDFPFIQLKGAPEGDPVVQAYRTASRHFRVVMGKNYRGKKSFESKSAENLHQRMIAPVSADHTAEAAASYEEMLVWLVDRASRLEPAQRDNFFKIILLRALNITAEKFDPEKPDPFILALKANVEKALQGQYPLAASTYSRALKIRVGARLAADEHFEKIQEMTRRIAAPPAPGESDGDRVRLVVELSEYLDGSGAVAIEGENALHIYTAFNQTQESDIPAVEEITQEHLDEMLAKKDPPELVAALTRLMRLIGAASPILTRRGERLNLALRGAAILALLHQDEGLRLTALQVLAGLPQDQTEDLIFMMRFMAAERSYGERMILEIVRFLESRGDVDGLHEIMLRPDARRVVRDRAVEALGAVAQKDDPEALAATETMIRELFNFDLDTDQVAGIMNALKDSRHPERAAPAIIAFMLLDEESELAQAAESTFSILAGHLDVHLGIKPPHAEAARLAAPQPTPEHGFAESAAAELEAVKDLAGRAEKRRVPAGDYAIALPQTRHSAVLRLGGGGAVLISPAGRQSVAVGTAESAAENDAPAVRAVYARILDSPEKRFVEHDLARYWSPADPDGRVLRAVVRELAKALEPLKDRVRVRFLFNGISILSLTADAALSESLIKSVQGSLNAYHVEELPQGRPAIQDLTNEDLEKPGTDGRGFVLSAQDPSDSAQDIEMRNPVLTLLAQIGLATGDSIQADDPVVALLRQLTRQPDFNHLDAEKLRIGDRAAVRSQRRRFSIKPLTAQLTETLIRIIRSTTAAALSA